MSDELNAALAMHQQGLLRQAVQIYEQILSHDPEDVDVMHLLGVATLQQGDASRAIELIGQAISLNPSHLHCTPIWLKHIG